MADAATARDDGSAEGNGSFRASLLYLLLGDVAAILMLLGGIMRGATGGMLLAGAATVPLIAVGLVRPHIVRLGWNLARRSLRCSLPALAAVAVGTALTASALAMGTAGRSNEYSLVQDDLGPVDELVVIPPGASFEAAADVVARTLAVPEIRALIDADPLPLRRTEAVLSRPGLAPLLVQLVEMDTVRAARFGGPDVKDLDPQPVGAGHALVTRDLADVLGISAGASLPAPLNLIIDGVIERRGITGLPTEDGDRVPNLVVGPGTVELLVANGWSAPVQTALALSNVGDSVDGNVYSNRVASALRGALANADALEGDVLFGDTNDAGLDRVMVETVKDRVIRQEQARRFLTSRALGLVSVLGATVGSALVAVAAAQMAARRRRDVAIMRTAGMSRSAAVGVIGSSGWLTVVLPVLAGTGAGAMLARLLRSPASATVGGVQTTGPVLDITESALFACGLMLLVAVLSTVITSTTFTLRPVISELSSSARSAMSRNHWGAAGLLATGGAALGGFGLRRNSDLLVLLGASLVVGSVAVALRFGPVLALLLPIGLAAAGDLGSWWSVTSAGLSAGLVASAIGGLALLRFAGDLLVRHRPADMTLEGRQLAQQALMAGSMRFAVLAGASLLVAAAGVSASTIAASADVSGAGTTSLLVRSLAEPALTAEELAVRPGVAVVAPLSVIEVDGAIGGNTSGFRSLRLVAGPATFAEAGPPALSDGATWAAVLGTPGTMAVSPDAYVGEDGAAPAVGDTLFIRDRTSGRTMTVSVGAVLAAAHPFAPLWMADTTASSLTGTTLRSSVMAVAGLPGATQASLAASLRGAYSGRPVQVLNGNDLAAVRWPTALPMVSTTRRIANWAGAVAALGLALLALRSLIERRRDLRPVLVAGVSRTLMRRALATEQVFLATAGLAMGVLVGALHAWRVMGSQPSGHGRVDVPLVRLALVPLLTLVLVAVASQLMARLAVHRDRDNDATC